MRISLTMPNNHRVTALLQPWQDEVGGAQIGEVAALADRLGFSRLTVGEHFLMPREHVELSGAHYVEAPTALAYLAGHTSRIRLISNVSIVALKHPVVSAKQWAVLDWLSGGRADLMVGAGWLKDEFEALGVDFHTRGRRLDECVEAMRRIWASELASFHGEFFEFHQIASEPKPLQPGGVPLWFAGDVPRAYARVAKWGVGWSPHLLSPSKIAEGIERIHSHPDYHGQRIGVFFNLASLRLAEEHRVRPDDHDFDTWNVQQLVDQLGWVRELGVTEVTPPLPRLASYQHFLDRLHWLAEEIMPRVAGD
jgi:probable F420-dependent oxidoreductase